MNDKYTPDYVQLWKNLERQSENNEKGFAEIRQILKEIAEEHKKVEKAQRLTEDAIMQTQLAQQQTEKMIKDLTKNVNGIADSNGMAAETLIANTLENTRTLNGWVFNSSQINVAKNNSKLNLRDQYDLVLENDEILALVEIKYRVREKDVLDLLERKIPNYKLLFPNESRNIVGVVAGLSIENQAIVAATDNGIFAITLSGDEIKVINSNYKEFC